MSVTFDNITAFFCKLSIFSATMTKISHLDSYYFRI